MVLERVPSRAVYLRGKVGHGNQLEALHSIEGPVRSPSLRLYLCFSCFSSFLKLLFPDFSVLPNAPSNNFLLSTNGIMRKNLHEIFLFPHRIYER